MATPETPLPHPVNCDHCREPIPSDRILPLLGRVLCEPCYSETVSALKQAEAFWGSGLRLKKNAGAA